MTLTTTSGDLPIDICGHPGEIFLVYHLAGAAVIIADLLSALGKHVIGEPASGHGDEMQVTTNFGSVEDCKSFLTSRGFVVV